MTHPTPETCDQCNQPATTQVTIGIAYGLYCASHGTRAELARVGMIDRRNREAARRANRNRPNTPAVTA